MLHPIAITPDGDLIAGQRRLTTCKRLGWEDIAVRVVNLTEIVCGKLAENAIRKDSLPSEIDAIWRALAEKMATPVGRPPKEIPQSFRIKEAGDTSEGTTAITNDQWQPTPSERLPAPQPSQRS